mgnify:FL=1|tara:strand:+ start:271 stop:693 length:423 start_codon:yes stop_codon:yes gene_type:complete
MARTHRTLAPILSLFALAIAAPLAAQETGPTDPATGMPEWERIARQCVFMEDHGAVDYTGPCEEFYDYGTGAHTISFGERSFEIEEVDPMLHELPWMVIGINGAPAMAYLNHRAWISYATNDLSIILDVCERLDEIDMCE